MRHRNKTKILGRESAHRNALFRNLADSLVLHGRIETTVVKAKALRGYVEPLITKAKKGGLAARRALFQSLYTDGAVKKMMDEIGPKYATRPGGYTRVVKTGPRKNDGAEMAIIEFVE